MMTSPSTSYIPRGELLIDEPMSKHTSWRVGGPADQFFIPADRDDLIQFLVNLDPGIEVTWIGLGSNLLVRDGGVRGVVIVTHGCLKNIERVNQNRIYVESGVPGAKIARFSVRNNLRGAEFFAGIPGTFGGALAMNAGAFGGETWDVVTKVETIGTTGRTVTRSPMEFDIGYRKVSLPKGEWFLSGEILLTPGEGEEGHKKIKQLLSQRSNTQPIKIPNAGSVFRNPDGDYAARLIECCDLKGTRKGRASVSTLHANFIVNEGGASAADIEYLIEHVRHTVQEKQGIELECEVRIIGEGL